MIPKTWTTKNILAQSSGSNVSVKLSSILPLYFVMLNSFSRSNAALAKMNPDKTWNWNATHRIREFHEIRKKKSKNKQTLRLIPFVTPLNETTVMGLGRSTGRGLISMTMTSRPHGMAMFLPPSKLSSSTTASQAMLQLMVCRGADKAFDYVLKLNVLELLWSSRHNLQWASLLSGWAWRKHRALLMLLLFPGVYSLEQENLKKNIIEQIIFYWCLRFHSKSESQHIRVKTSPE